MKKAKRKATKTAKPRGGKGPGKKTRSISRQARKKTRKYYRGGRPVGAISARTRFLIETILKVLDSVKLTMSARQIFYQCVSNGAVENTKSAYDRVCNLLVMLRRNGRVPYSRIVDRTREMHRAPTWDSIGEGLNSLRNRYRRNPWSNQQVVPMIGMEKDALAGVIEDVVDEYAVPLFVCRGRPSLSLLYDWANEIRRLLSLGKEVRIFYFGDFDPTGVAIPQGIQESMWNDFHLDVKLEVAGLLQEDKEKFHLLPIALKMGDEMKKGDPLVAGFLAKYGPNAASELDALPPAELRRRVKEKIESCFDEKAWEEVDRVEKEELQTLGEYVETSGYKPPEPEPPPDPAAEAAADAEADKWMAGFVTAFLTGGADSIFAEKKKEKPTDTKDTKGPQAKPDKPEEGQA